MVVNRSALDHGFNAKNQNLIRVMFMEQRAKMRIWCIFAQYVVVEPVPFDLVPFQSFFQPPKNLDQKKNR